MKHEKLLTILLTFNLLFIWGNSLLPREVSGEISDTVMEAMNRAAEKLGLGDDFFTVLIDLDGDGIPERSSHIVRKMAHLTEFACLGALLVLRLQHKTDAVKLSVVFSALTASSDELLQVFSGRGSQIQDVFLDISGSFVGIILAYVSVKKRTVEKNRRKE